MIEVEACIDCSNDSDVRRSVENACRGGADRIELCSDLRVSGLTPSIKHIEIAREAFGARLGLLVMIRPRPGDFAYTNAERDAMLLNIEAAKAAGADGIVVGVVRGGRLDLPVLDPVLSVARQRRLSVTFHRAFDDLDSPERAIEMLIERGVKRILTSGVSLSSSGSILDGIENVRSLVRCAAGRIEIVVAGGISSGNVGSVLDKLPQDALSKSAVSVHAYSSLLENGITSKTLLEELISACNE